MTKCISQISYYSIIQEYYLEVAKQHVTCLQTFERGSHNVCVIYESAQVDTIVSYFLPFDIDPPLISSFRLG